MTNPDIITLRTLTFDELEAVSGAKPKVVSTIVERCVSYFEKGVKVSVCRRKD